MPEVTRRAEAQPDWPQKCSLSLYFICYRVFLRWAGPMQKQRCATKCGAPFLINDYLSPPVRIESALVALCPHRAWVPQSTADAVEVLLFQHAVEAPHNTD